jgi:ABC-type phosphate transport system substrate-binding protein
LGCCGKEKKSQNSTAARIHRLLLLLVIVGVSAGRPAVGQDAVDLKVIVHPSNPVNSLSTAEVSRFFLEENGQWSNGTPVVPIDQTPESPARSTFSNEVLGRDVASVRAHWRRLIFQGKGVPPPTRSSEQEIIQFVSVNRTAIGYVSSSSLSGGEVKVITVTNP